MTLVFKILATEEWRAAEAVGGFSGSAVDRADGYIHFSTAAQAPETAAKWFAGREDSDPGRSRRGRARRRSHSGSSSRGGALFPHLYGALPMRAVVWSRPLPLGPDGRHAFGDIEA